MKTFTYSIYFAVLANLFIATNVCGQITQVGTAQSADNSGTTITITKPTGLTVGDVMIANITQNDNSSGTDIQNNATSSGWTVIDGRALGAGTDPEYWGTLLYKVAVAADLSATNYAFALDGDADGGVGAIVAFRGVDVTGGVTATGAAGGPFDIDPGIINNIADDGTLNASSITTVSANAAVIMFGLIGNNITINNNWQTATSPGALVELYDENTNNGDDNAVGAAWALNPTAGSTGAGSATLSATDPNGAILIALKAIILPASLTLSPSATQNIATGSSVNFTATPSNFNGSGNHTFTWTATGATIPGSNPATSTTTNSKNITFPAAGIYNVIVRVQRGTSDLKDTTVVKVFDAPASPNLWASSSNGSRISSFSVNGGIYFNGPSNLFTPTYPGSTTGGSSTAAIGRTNIPNPNSGYFYWLPNTSGNNGVVEVFGATSTGATPTRIGSLDVNAGSNNSLGFVRLGMANNGTGWILAGDNSAVTLASFSPNGVNTVTPVIVDASVTLSGGSASTFDNGDMCISSTGAIFALANDGNGVTQIFIGNPNGSSTTLTKKWDLVDENGDDFTGSVNGVAFDAQGSLYVSTSTGLYFIDATTVNNAGPGLVQCRLVWSGSGLQDLASNIFPVNSPLPVTFTDFTVSQSNNNALLNWITATEINNDHFEIERSADGINFSKAGSVEGNGTSSIIHTYQFADPINSASRIIYYRLKQVDLDGKSTYSKIVSLRLNGMALKNYTVFPNPFTSDIKLQIKSEKEINITIQLHNAAGQLEISHKAILQPGDNVVVLYDLGALKPGLHLMKIVSENGIYTEKIIKK